MSEKIIYTYLIVAGFIALYCTISLIADLIYQRKTKKELDEYLDRNP